MSFLTIAGEEQLANKQGNGESVNIEKFVLAYMPDQGDEPADRVETLPDDALIVDTRSYTKLTYVNGNQVVYSLVMDATVGDYDFNWIGLLDEENVLIAVSYITTIEKRKTAGSVRGNIIARNFLLKYTGIQNLTAATVPAETWQLDFSARLVGIDERERLSNVDIFGHESFLNDAWWVSGSNGTYHVATGTGYVGGVRIENEDDTLTKTLSYPNQLWLNVSLQGDVSDRSAVVEFIMDSGEFEDYIDDNGVVHYLTKLADIADDGSVTDTRTIYENVAQHEAKDDPHPQYIAYTDAALTTAKDDATEKANAALTTAKDDATEKANAALASAKDYVGETTGSIHFFATQMAPAGFIKANGTAVSRTTYAILFSKIGTTFGVGDGSTTFNVPDMRGEFARGWDDGRGVDVDRVFGSWQEDEFESHIHAVKHSYDDGRVNSSGGYLSSDTSSWSGRYNRSDAISSTGGLETRPRNIALAAYIKY